MIRSAGIEQNGQGSSSEAFIVFGDGLLALVLDRRQIVGRELAPEGRLESNESEVLSIVRQILPLLKLSKRHSEHERPDSLERDGRRLLHAHPRAFDDQSPLRPVEIELVERARDVVDAGTPFSIDLREQRQQ